MAQHLGARQSGRIYLGIGGWTFEPWRGVFYPEKLPKTRELEYAAQHLTSIEINGTFYRTQTPATFRKWASEVPDGFVFSVKAPRYTTHRRELAEAGDSVQTFLNSGVTELGDRLGPLLWQFPPTKKFEEADFAAFLALLPAQFDGRRLRDVVEVRHGSFLAPAFIALLRKAAVAVVFSEHAPYPATADDPADFVYLRLQKGEDTIETAYPPQALDAWAGRLRAWAQGEGPTALPRVEPHVDPTPAPAAPRDVFAYVI